MAAVRSLAKAGTEVAAVDVLKVLGVHQNLFLFVDEV
jgi:hypothetical protein